jgi:hypothetical protein
MMNLIKLFIRFYLLLIIYVLQRSLSIQKRKLKIIQLLSFKDKYIDYKKNINYEIY